MQLCCAFAACRGMTGDITALLTSVRPCRVPLRIELSASCAKLNH
jgi:hypothetical protein